MKTNGKYRMNETDKPAADWITGGGMGVKVLNRCLGRWQAGDAAPKTSANGWSVWKNGLRLACGRFYEKDRKRRDV